MKTFPRYKVETVLNLQTGKMVYLASERVLRGYNYRYASCGMFETREEAQAKVDSLKADWAARRAA